jgi:hypothetical protein
MGVPCWLSAHGKGGARTTIKIKYATSSSEKLCPSVKQAGKKEGSLGEGIVAHRATIKNQCPDSRQKMFELRPKNTAHKKRPGFIPGLFL